MVSRFVFLIMCMLVVSTLSFGKEVALKVGLVAGPRSMDPLYEEAGYTKPFMMHMYEALVKVGPNYELLPGLATGWSIVDNYTWRFNLRKGVKFHDGSALDANDVLYSFCRVRNVPNSISPFTFYINNIKDIVAVDDNTLDFKVFKKMPLLPNNVAMISILPSPKNHKNIKFDTKKCGISDWTAPSEYNDGKLAIGTGPFKYGSYKSGDGAVLIKNDDYWGKKANVDKLYFYFMSDNGARSAAILSGQVDIIEGVPINYVDKISSNSNLKLISGRTGVSIFYMFDSYNHSSPKISGTNGKNPFLDKRVRLAFIYAIDRDLIVNNIMGGLALKTSQLIPKGIAGYDSSIKLPSFNLAKAKKLMKEAGYESGFKLVISAPSDRYTNGVKIAQALAQMLSKIGVEATIETFPKSVYFSRANKFEYSLYMGATATDNGDGSQVLNLMMHTHLGDFTAGGGNRGRYSNAKVDKLVEKSVSEMDAGKRVTMYKEANRIFSDDIALIPLYFQMGVWAVRKNIDFKARMDLGTVLNDVKVK